MSIFPDSTNNFSGLCGRCNKTDSTFDPSKASIIKTLGANEPGGRETQQPVERFFILTCHNCQEKTLVIEILAPASKADFLAEVATEPADEKSTAAHQNTKLFWHGFQWWPENRYSNFP